MTSQIQRRQTPFLHKVLIALMVILVVIVVLAYLAMQTLGPA